MEYWETLHKNIACSGKLIVQPDGEVAPEASCTSYNAGLKKGEAELKLADAIEAYEAGEGGKPPGFEDYKLKLSEEARERPEVPFPSSLPLHASSLKGEGSDPAAAGTEQREEGSVEDAVDNAHDTEAKDEI